MGGAASGERSLLEPWMGKDDLGAVSKKGVYNFGHWETENRKKKAAGKPNNY